MSFKINKVIFEGERPDVCADCELLHKVVLYTEDKRYLCTAQGFRRTEYLSRPDWCPLVTHNQAFDWMFKEAKATVYIKEQIEKIMLKGR